MEVLNQHPKIERVVLFGSSAMGALDDKIELRDLRNRVFHHERILHWGDLDQRHQAISEIIKWMSPELPKLNNPLDRFASIRKSGLGPWADNLQNHWPANPA